MKSLSLVKPLIIMMLGHPGAGKSFFARQFSEMFGAPLVSFDRLRFELFAEPTFSADENTIIERIALYQAEELIKTHRTFIVDGGASSRNDRRALYDLAKRADYGTLIIWVQTDPATCQARATKRNPRKADDQYNATLTEEQFKTLVKRLSPPTTLEPTVVISGKHTYPTQAKTVLKKLVTPREEAEAAPQAEERTTPQLPTDRPPQLRPEQPRRRSVTIN